MAQQGVENSISGLILKTKIGYLFSISDKLEAKIDYIVVTSNHFSISIVTQFVENQLLLRGIWMLKYNIVEPNESMVSSFKIFNTFISVSLDTKYAVAMIITFFHISVDVFLMRNVK